MVARALLAWLLTAGATSSAASAIDVAVPTQWPVVYRMTRMPCGPDEGCAFRLVPVPITNATEERPELL